MNVLINFATLKTGGGQNVAMNFLLSYKDVRHPDVEWHFLVAKDSEPHKFLLASGERRVMALSRSAALRMLQELFWCRILLRKWKIDVVYSYFGYALLPRTVPQISGSADSNLYFPEVKFWDPYPPIQRLKKYIIDRYRLHGVRSATAVVFENEALRRRAVDLYGLRRTKLVLPSITFPKGATRADPLYSRPKYPVGLFLCGWHLNKNVLLIPELAAEMRSLGKPMVFLLTAFNDGSKISRAFDTNVERHGVSDLVKTIGPVSKIDLPRLYSGVDFVFLLSLLESFSNNILEAWHFAKPLVISDQPWARAICADAALYVNRDCPRDISLAVSNLLSEPHTRDRLTSAGKQQLAAYPSITERISIELDLLRECARGY